MARKLLHKRLPVLTAGPKRPVSCYTVESKAHTGGRCLQSDRSESILVKAHQSSHLASGIWSQADGGWSLFGLHAAMAGRKQWAKEAAETFTEDAVGEAVDETITEAVADCQPCCEEGRHLVVI